MATRPRTYTLDCFCSKPDESNPDPQYFFKIHFFYIPLRNFFSWGLRTKNSYRFHARKAACSTALLLLDIITVVNEGSPYEEFVPAARFPQVPALSFLLDAHIHHSSLSSDTLRTRTQFSDTTNEVTKTPKTKTKASALYFRCPGFKSQLLWQISRGYP